MASIDVNKRKHIVEAVLCLVLLAFYTVVVLINVVEDKNDEIEQLEEEKEIVETYRYSYKNDFIVPELEITDYKPLYVEGAKILYNGERPIKVYFVGDGDVFIDYVNSRDGLLIRGSSIEEDYGSTQLPYVITNGEVAYDADGNEYYHFKYEHQSFAEYRGYKDDFLLMLNWMNSSEVLNDFIIVKDSEREE